MPPAASPGGGRRRSPSEVAMRSVKRQRHPVDSVSSGSGSDPGSGSESDGGFVSDLREIVGLLRLIKGGANKDGHKMCEQIVSSVAADIQTMLEDTKLKFEKERQNLLNGLSNTSKECESSLNEEHTKLQETYEMFCEQTDAHLQTFEDLFLQVEVEKKKLNEQYDHYRKEETSTLSELGDTFSEKTTNAKPSPKRMEDEKSFIVFRKSIGSFLECGSDDDFDLDNE
ncbi:unnamed protein product [Alopecurus aequalis]